MNRRDAAQHVVLLRRAELAKRGFVDERLANERAQGHDRRHGVHDLVREDADQLLPGVDFLSVQLVTDVLERNELVAPLEQLERRRVQHQLQRLVADSDAEQSALAIRHLLQQLRQPRIDALERAQAVQVRNVEQSPRWSIRHSHHARLIEAAQRHGDMLDDRLQVAMVRILLPVETPEGPGQRLVGRLQLHEDTALSRAYVRGGEVVVVHEGQEACQVTRGSFHVPDEVGHTKEGQRTAEQHGRQPLGVEQAPEQQKAQTRKGNRPQHDVEAEATQSHNGSSFCTAWCAPSPATAPRDSNCPDVERWPAEWPASRAPRD